MGRTFINADELGEMMDQKQKDMNKAAKDIRRIYEALVNAGFTQEQAIELTGAMIRADA
ncbi:MAG: hypothetical protein IJJ07_00080 [Lachnospiraceae bacterium]|nr:hypothetical protein [Lachnospiraceae bacterium]